MLDKFHRPFCQHVLPLTYDDSMSYYEVLCKIIRRLNMFTSDVQDYILDVLKEMGLDGTVRFRCVYNVKDYGAKGDGISDDRWGIQNALNAAYEAGGGIVFIPEGHYLTSKCIAIGDNCTLMGSGAGSVLELTDLTPYWGVAVIIVGSNSACCNMKILYQENPNKEHPGQPVINGSEWGALGVTTSDYYSAVNQTHYITAPDVRNVIMSDLWTEGFYALQIEPGTLAENLIYRNIYAKGGMMSIQGGTPHGNTGQKGKIKNVLVENVTCDYFRILGGSWVNQVYINDLKTHYIYSNGNDVHFENFIADVSVSSPFDNLGAPINRLCCQFYSNNADTDSSVPLKRSSARNGLIIGGGEHGPADRGLTLVSTSKYLFENITVRGFTGSGMRNISGAGHADTVFISCDAEESGVQNSPVGYGFGNRMGSIMPESAGGPVWGDAYTDLAGSITIADGYEASGYSASSTYVKKNGNIVYGDVVVAKPSGTLALDEVICTIGFKPSAAMYVTGFMFDSRADNSVSAPATFKIETNGQVKMIWNSRHSPSLYNGAAFSFTYGAFYTP